MIARATTSYVCITSVLLIVACRPAQQDRLAADVARYIDEMQAWSQAEVEAGQATERILATHFVDDAEVFRQIAESRPRVARHLHSLQAYQAATADVRAVHEAYTASWISLLEAYTEIEHGLREADPARLSTGRSLLLDWRRSLRLVAQDLRDLSELAKVDPASAAADRGER